MPTGIMTTLMQTKKVGNTPSPRNTSFLKIIGFFLLLISLWNYLAHKKLTPPHRAPLSLTELDCILPMECVSLSINLLSLYHHDSSNLSWMKPRMLTWWPLPGTPWRPELWPSFHFPATQSVMWSWGWTTFCIQTAIVFFTFSAVFNKLHGMFNTLL